MPRTLKECEEAFGGRIWTTIERDGQTFVFRWPDPDAFDEAFAEAVTGKNTGDFKHVVRSFEIITKASCCSHNAQELDLLRRHEPPKNYGLFQQLGAELMNRLKVEAPAKGKG